MSDLVRPQRLVDVFGLLEERGARILAGGTDSYVLTDRDRLTGRVIDILDLPELAGVLAGPSGLRIGACTTWAALAQARLPAGMAALQQAAVQVGGRQIQNAGTIGGNLCNASPAADGVPALLVMDAQVELVSSRGLRVIGLADFLKGPRQTTLAPDEVMTAVLIPAHALNGMSRFEKLGARAYLVISIAMVAVRLVIDKGLVEQAAVAVGACSAVARRLPSVEAALTGIPAHDAVAQIKDADVAAALSPMDDIRGSASYRATAAAELLRRAVGGLLP